MKNAHNKWNGLHKLENKNFKNVETEQFF